MQKEKISWSEYLESKGFILDQSNDYYKKNLGFGRFIIVDHIVRGLFKVTVGNNIVYDNFVGSAGEFKKIIEKALATT